MKKALLFSILISLVLYINSPSLFLYILFVALTAGLVFFSLKTFKKIWAKNVGFKLLASLEGFVATILVLTFFEISFFSLFCSFPIGSLTAKSLITGKIKEFNNCYQRPWHYRVIEVDGGDNFINVEDGTIIEVKYAENLLTGEIGGFRETKVLPWYYRPMPNVNGTTREQDNGKEKTQKTRGLKTYRNEEYDFEIKYPSDWQVYASNNPHDNVINIYKTGNPPFTHHNNVTQVSIFPEGLGMEGPAGESNKLTVDLTPEEENIVNQFILSDSKKPFGYFVNFKNVPTAKWGEFGYVWASVEVKNRSIICRDKTKDIKTCEPLADGMDVIGEVDEVEWNTIKEILATFKFIKEENSKSTVNSKSGLEEPFAKMAFLQHNTFGSGKGGSLFKTNYDGTGIEKINNDKVYALAVSPLFTNILYASLDEFNFDFGAKKYLTIKLSEFPDFKNIKKIAEYSLEDDLASDNISRFTTELNWSNNGRIFSYFLRLKQNFSEGDVLFYIDNNNTNKGGNFVTNPFKDELSHYFDKIRRYRISPSGKFIALTIEERGDRGLILYDLAKEDNIIVLTDIFSDDFFFDAQDNFYYSIVGKYKSDQKWIKRNVETELSDIFYNKPDFWDKFLNAVFAPKLDKMAYICADYYDKVCIASSDGQNEKVFSNNDVNISDIQDLIWDKDEKYLFFTANLNNKTGELPDLSLWVVDLKKDNFKKIADLD